MTHINGVGNNNNFTPMQRTMQQAAVTRTMDVPIGKTNSADKDDFYGGMLQLGNSKPQVPVYKGPESMGDYLDYLVNVLG